MNVGNIAPSPERREALFPKLNAMNVGNGDPSPEMREALFPFCSIVTPTALCFGRRIWGMWLLFVSAFVIALCLSSPKIAVLQDPNSSLKPFRIMYVSVFYVCTDVCMSVWLYV